MNNPEKLALLEEMMELDEGTLVEDTELEGLPEWDSMAALSLIVLVDENFSKKLTAAQIKNFKTIKDILDFMN